MNISLNIANMLTLCRLLVLPVFAYLALSDEGTLQIAAAILFGLAALTDWLDGYFARRLNQVSEFGAMLDPLVDRIFLITSLVILYLKVSDSVPLWTVIIIVGRDILMMTGWIFIKTLRGTPVSVTYAGKLSTAVLMVSLFLILISESIAAKQFSDLGVAIYYLGLMLSVATGIRYAYTAIKRDDKKPMT